MICSTKRIYLTHILRRRTCTILKSSNLYHNTRLALAIHNFAKCKLISEKVNRNLRSFATFANQCLVKVFATISKFAKKKKKRKNAKENLGEPLT